MKALVRDVVAHDVGHYFELGDETIEGIEEGY
jgi:predicted Zn-dependent protease with MMP-like domain